MNVLKAINNWRVLDENYVLHSLKLFVREQLVRPSLLKLPSFYPTDLNLEVTTVCDSHCKYCCRDRLVNSGEKPVEHLSLQNARHYIDRLRELTSNIPDEELSFAPVGFGEPLLSPHFFKIVAYIRELFPHIIIHANTNAISLNLEVAEELVDCGLDDLILSINFADRECYRRECGVDKLPQVLKNVIDFLRLKGSHLPRSYVQLLDREENHVSLKNFTRLLKPYLKGGNRLYFREFIDFSSYPRGNVKYVCSEPWSVMFVDLKGNVFPCCLNAWGPNHELLKLGHIDEDSHILFSNLRKLRAAQLAGNYNSTCKQCAGLDVNSQWYKIRFLDQVKKLIKT